MVTLFVIKSFATKLSFKLRQLSLTFFVFQYTTVLHCFLFAVGVQRRRSEHFSMVQDSSRMARCPFVIDDLSFVCFSISNKKL